MDKELTAQQSSQVAQVGGKHNIFPHTRAGWVITGVTTIGSIIVCTVSQFDGGAVLGSLFVTLTVSGFSDDVIHALLYGRRFPEHLAMNNGKSAGKWFQESASDFAERWLGFERNPHKGGSFKSWAARWLGMPVYDEPPTVEGTIVVEEDGQPKDEPMVAVQKIVEQNGRFPEPIDMAMVVEQGFKPSRDGILLMNTNNGHATEKMSKLHHIGLGGSSGRGKTNTTRLIVSQLLACGAKVYMVNPNFAPIKQNGNRLEDWRPIAERLQEPVARNADDIKRLLNHFMKIFEERREREQLTPKRGADLFLVLGEWPVIVEEYPDAEKIIGRLLRQSRQYGIHIIAEFQDALISTIKGSGGTRANYGTAFFFGGDVTTAKTLLSLTDGVKIDNTDLGDMGAVYLKSFSSQAIPGRVPFFSNKALYMLLGFPKDPVTDELVDEDEFYEDEEDEESLSEREQLYEDVLKVWGKGKRSLYEIQAAIGLGSLETEALLQEMNEWGLIVWRKEAESVQTKVLPVIPEKGRRAEEIDINAAIAVYNAGNTSRYQLAKIFDLNENQGRRLKEIIEARAE